MEIIPPVGEEGRLPSLFESLIPVVFMMIALVTGIFIFGTSPHIPLLVSVCVAAMVAMRLGFSWRRVERGMLDAVRLAMQAVVILMVIGTIIASWIAGGIVPTLIYYGLNILEPQYFLVAACAICCIISIAAGNAWTAAGTIGIAIMGIGYGLGMQPEMVAGAVISGVYFGDKISPLSESTNLAPGIVGVDLFEHIQYMLYTTIPALVISLILFTILGFSQASTMTDTSAVTAALQADLKGIFIISPWLLLVPAFIIVMMIFKIPAFPGLMIGSTLGVLCAIFVQGADPSMVLNSLYDGYHIETDNKTLSDLLNNGGITAVLPTVSLVIIAMCFGGILEFTKIFEVIVGHIARIAQKTKSLIISTVFTCITGNIVGCDQYMSIIIPGRMYADEYRKRGIKAKVLSRTLEDAGTMTSPLIPWNTCGAFMTTTLGVASFSYLPYTFLCLLSPLIAIFYACTGWTIETYEDGEKPKKVKRFRMNKRLD
ncbi:Na+/H+ antiporter NhaC [Wohlfahrtiimonas chitiniclastica]|uniref:Na+/H+ antiporter NhaC n=1 Tax=Wohlfahrtiimonas chitiniclastica TaxID=400946 RepID=UPI001BCC5967|nr:Na+/H+ antiporter NhaC [Wohlfahrtiimonas chitiniclastica]MBS7828934.1 Na+/H+ antiporter NhaC [Wohlfahrtiimonas chitiniclastica]